MNWYFQDGDQTVGPLDQNEFHELVSRGRITPQTMVRREGEEGWMPHSEAIRASKIDRYREENQSSQIDLRERAKGPEGSRWVPGMTGGSLNYASFGARLMAKLIDSFIIMVAFFVFTLLMGIMMAGVSPGEELNIAGLLIIVVGYFVTLLGPYAYYAYFTGKTGATPGKKAMGIKVTNAEGRLPSWGQAWGRAFAETLSGLTFLIGYLLMLFDNEKRTLHDMICNTRVIRNL